MPSEADVFPHIGSRPIAEIDAPELLDVLRRVEKRGVIETWLFFERARLFASGVSAFA
jgi:hypothetical protein